MIGTITRQVDIQEMKPIGNTRGLNTDITVHQGGSRDQKVERGPKQAYQSVPDIDVDVLRMSLWPTLRLHHRGNRSSMMRVITEQGDWMCRWVHDKSDHVRYYDDQGSHYVYVQRRYVFCIYWRRPLILFWICIFEHRGNAYYPRLEKRATICSFKPELIRPEWTSP